MATIWALLIYWLVIFVGCYVVIEIGQDQLYDEVTPHIGLKVTGGSLLLALMLAAFYYKGMAASFDSMFTNNILCTVFQALVWFGVFMLIFQFHPWHALGLGIATMLLVQGLATMGVNSILSPTPAAVSRPAAFATSKPVRQSLAPAPAARRPGLRQRPSEPRRQISTAGLLRVLQSAPGRSGSREFANYHNGFRIRRADLASQPAAVRHSNVAQAGSGTGTSCSVSMVPV